MFTFISTYVVGMIFMRIWAVVVPLVDIFGQFQLYSYENDLGHLICIFYNVSFLYFSATYSMCYLLHFSVFKHSHTWARTIVDLFCSYVILLILHLSFHQGSKILSLLILANVSGIMWAFIMLFCVYLKKRNYEVIRSNTFLI